MAPPRHTPTAPADRGDYVVVPPSTQGRLRLLTVGPVELDLDGKQLRIAGQVTHIPMKEFQLLAMLMDNAGLVLTRRQLLDECWEPGHPDGTKTLDVHIKRVREHLAAADPDLRARLRTVRGYGYVFDADPPGPVAPAPAPSSTPDGDRHVFRLPHASHGAARPGRGGRA
ncbi:response regulator transcription factor [Streptomyces sp. NBC_01450]|uniref:winged helix-turn-helix domain-containing protein n=1 Tax=Streptomyces sp. NBC_01450 TaxID=2903871 RepID=UPI002E369D5C|nr:response regulator transcription factor [Streptomyces sp. NBC_01450]